jgi:hypothetical protein
VGITQLYITQVNRTYNMAGLLPNEGEHLVANMLFKNADVDRGTGLELGLFTNSTVSETTSASSLTEPTGGSYARKTLTDSSWTVSADIASYPRQTFTATGSAFTGSIYGYFIVTKGTTPRIIAIEVDGAGPYTVTQDGMYDITPNITIA